MRTHRFAFTAVALAGVMLAGCGGSSYKGLSKADFITQADAICKKFDDQVNAATQGIDPSADQQKAVDVLQNQLLPAEREQVKELRKLKPPKEDRDTIKKMLDAVDDGVDQADKDLKSDPSKVFADDYDPFKSANEQAQAYGLKECGQS